MQPAPCVHHARCPLYALCFDPYPIRAHPAAYVGPHPILNGKPRLILSDESRPFLSNEPRPILSDGSRPFLSNEPRPILSDGSRPFLSEFWTRSSMPSVRTPPYSAFSSLTKVRPRRG